MKAASEPVENHEETEILDDGLLSQQIESERAKIWSRTEKQKYKAYIFSVETQTDKTEDVAESLEELNKLLETLGDGCVGQTIQKLTKINPSTLVGSGKAKDISAIAKHLEADYIVCDKELSPSQSRNLELIVRMPVLDRAAVILQIFQKQAKTREARCQVSIAHLEYLLPRLSSSWISWERQGGGASGGGAAHSKGAGETQMELDARKINENLTTLKKELEEIRAQRENQRKNRRSEYRVSLVGYTNAGKTSLMNVLTGSELSVRDALFETLDSTVRLLKGTHASRILVSDTVGFIRNLPHGLVASFQSTLEETKEADLILHVIDGSSAQWEEHKKVTQSVLKEIEADKVRTLLVLNKSDKGTPALLPEEDFFVISTKNSQSTEELRDLIVNLIEKDHIECEFFIPYSHSKIWKEIYDSAQIITTDAEETGTRVVLKAAESSLLRLKKLLQTNGAFNE